jgi:hypothetical protein
VKDAHARQFYERTALSKNKAAMLTKGAAAKAEDVVTRDEAVKDPFVPELLNLKDDYSEAELKVALIQQLHSTTESWGTLWAPEFVPIKVAFYEAAQEQAIYTLQNFYLHTYSC